jgi:hypothetical protein
MNMNKPPDETLKQGRNRSSWLLVKIDSWDSKFWIYSLTLIDQIQTIMAHDRLLLCVHGYDIRSEMKPSLVGEIFTVLKIKGGVLWFWDPV